MPTSASILKASWYVGLGAPGLEDIFTWPPYSCSDLGALYWVYTSRQPFGSLCSSSEQFCCTPATSRWSLWKAPGGTRGQNAITSFPSHLHWLHRSAEFIANEGIFPLCFALQPFKLLASCRSVMHDHHVWLTFK